MLQKINFQKHMIASMYAEITVAKNDQYIMGNKTNCLCEKALRWTSKSS